MRLIMVIVSVGLLSVSLSGLAMAGMMSGLCKTQTEEAIRFVERFLDSAPDGFQIEPVRRS